MNNIEHDRQQQQFSMMVDGHQCVLDYQLNGNTMTVTHTGVPSAVGGRGLAAQITKFALDHAKAQDWRVIPACSYVAVYIERHPEYQSLLNA
ncbi:GNAT family N-acetyltransferase [Orrella sp. 11846]|uniref:GNAT family N-acetyltransferase n=1 Tax=Orrella sp. 11846 TaxID=3409913 RepID=UPI003B5958CC